MADMFGHRLKETDRLDCVAERGAWLEWWSVFSMMTAGELVKLALLGRRDWNGGRRNRK